MSNVDEIIESSSDIVKVADKTGDVLEGTFNQVDDILKNLNIKTMTTD